MFFHPFFVLFILYWIIKGLLLFIFDTCFFLLFILFGLLRLLSFFLKILDGLIKNRILHEFIYIFLNNAIREVNLYLIKQASFDFFFLQQPFINLLFVHLLQILQDMQMEPQRRLNLIAEHIKSENDSSVLYQSNNNGLIVTLNRPKALNSLNLEMVRNITSKLQFVNNHQVVWFQGSGGKSFCSGGDVKVLFQKQYSVEDRRTFFRQEFTLDYKVSQLNAIQISCWDGIVMGGGVGISVFAPFIIATEKTLFAMPEAKLGFFTDVGVNYILSRMRNNIGYYLGMTGARLKGQQVYIAGLANYYIPSSKIINARQDIIQLFSKEKVNNPKEKIAEVLGKYHSPSGKKQIQNELKIKELFSSSSGKDVYQKVKNTNDQFSNNIKKMIDEQCPVSVELIHRLITLSKKLSLRQVFVTDSIVVQHMCSNSDMKEGVRCVLMQKGAIPKWSCPTLQSVSEETIASFLKPINNSLPFKG